MADELGYSDPYGSPPDSGSPYGAPPDAHPYGMPPDTSTQPQKQPSAPVHPSKMSDDEIVLGLMKVDPAKWEKVKQSKMYRPGAVADLFTDPEGWWGSYVVGKNKDTPGTSVNRGVQSLAAGFNRANIAGGSLVGQLLSKATGGDYNTWNEIRQKANDINQNINQGRTPNQSGLDPANILGQGVFGAGLSTGAPAGNLSARAGGQAARAGAEAYLTTPGDSLDRAGSAIVAAPIAGSLTAVTGGAAQLWSKAKARKIAETVSKNRSPEDIANEIANDRFNDKNVGQFAQTASEQNMRGDMGKVSDDFYATADELAPTIESRLGSYLDTLRDIVNKRKLGGLREDEAKYFNTLLRNAEDAAPVDLGGGIGTYKKGNVPNTLDQLMDVYQEMSPMIRKQSLESGSKESLRALNAIRGAADRDLGTASQAVADSFRGGQSAYHDFVGPHKTDWLMRFRDTPDVRANDVFSELAQSKLSSKYPSGLAQEVSASTGPDPILYQFLRKGLGDADLRPQGYVQSMNKVLPTVDSLAADNPALAQQIRDTVTTARAAQVLGTVANWIPGSPTGIAGAFNPGYSGPGLVWKGLQTDRARALAALISRVPEGSDAHKNMLSMLAAITTGQQRGNDPGAALSAIQ